MIELALARWGHGMRSSKRFTKRRSTILFLSANPFGTDRLASDEESAAIERELCMSEGRDDFEFHSKRAVTIDEVMRLFNQLHPAVIHFSGHGGNGASASRRRMHVSRDVACVRTATDLSELCLQDERGNPQWVTIRAMMKMIETAAASARVVVLNACYSDPQADALRTVVDCVVGMTGAIHDEAALAFAVGFYRALGNRRSIGNAVEQAIATLSAKKLTDEDLPRCRTRKGVDASRLVLCDVDENTQRRQRS